MATTEATGRGIVRSKRGRLASWVLGLAIGALVMLMIGVLTLMFGGVSGEEFSPSAFKRRSFHYYELPVVRLQVWPIRRIDSTSALELDLVKQKLVVTKTTDPERWDLVRGFRGTHVVAQGDAWFLCRYLDQHASTGGQAWDTWTTQNPQLAKVFWPIVATLAEQELYFFIPDLFNLARGAKDPTAFDAALRSLVAEKYYEFGRALAKADKHAEAVELFTEGLKYATDKKSALQKALEASRKELPAAEKEGAEAK